MQLTLKLSGDLDPDQIDMISRSLVSELRQLDVVSAALEPEQPQSEDRKSAGSVTLGVILLAVIPAATPGVIAFLQNWALRKKNRVLKISRRSGNKELSLEFDVANITKKQVEDIMKLVDRSL